MVECGGVRGSVRPSSAVSICEIWNFLTLQYHKFDLSRTLVPLICLHTEHVWCWKRREILFRKAPFRLYSGSIQALWKLKAVWRLFQGSFRRRTDDVEKRREILCQPTDPDLEHGFGNKHERRHQQKQLHGHWKLQLKFDKACSILYIHTHKQTHTHTHTHTYYIIHICLYIYIYIYIYIYTCIYTCIYIYIYTYHVCIHT